MDHIAVIATFAPADGHRARVQTILQGMVVPTRAEPGCLQYDLYESENGFHLIERYTDDDAIEYHRTTGHYQAYRAEIADLLTRPIDVIIGRPLDAS